MPTRSDPYSMSPYAGYESDSRRRKHWLKVVLTIVGLVVGASALVGLAVALWLNSSLDDFEQIPVTVPDAVRPAPSESDAVNILLLGTDAGTERGGGTSILEDAASGSWPSGKHRSDATMLLHIAPDRDEAFVVSIPRDSYVPVHDADGEFTEDAKINSALSLHGPSGAIATVEQLTDVRVDHVAMVDWDGFKGITDALDGVDITVPGLGRQRMDGDRALDYVRDRKNLPGGDFDRVKRQQNFLRALMQRGLQRDVLINPLQLKSTLNAVTANVAVDDAFSPGDMRSLALSLRSLRPSDVTFMTVPTAGTDNVAGAGSIVRLDDSRADDLFEAMRDDDVAAWVQRDGGDLLPSPGAVN